MLEDTLPQTVLKALLSGVGATLVSCWIVIGVTAVTIPRRRWRTFVFGINAIGIVMMSWSVVIWLADSTPAAVAFLGGSMAIRYTVWFIVHYQVRRPKKR